MDAGYRQYKLIQDIRNKNSSCVIRLQDNAVYDILEQRPLTDDAQKAGVQRDMVVQLGCKDKQNDLTQPVRIIEVFHTCLPCSAQAGRTLFSLVQMHSWLHPLDFSFKEWGLYSGILCPYSQHINYSLDWLQAQ